SRLDALPDVPTMAEQGYPDLTVITWFGVHAPAGTPPEVVAKLNAEITKAVKNPDVAKVLLAQGLEPAGMSVEEFKAFMADQAQSITRKWKEPGAKIE